MKISSVLLQAVLRACARGNYICIVCSSSGGWLRDTLKTRGHRDTLKTRVQK